MEQRISIITLGVTNLDASRRFYERLGWTTATGNDETEIVAFNLQSFVLALYQREALSRDAGVVMSNQPTPPFTMAYNVRSKSEVDRVITSADTNGAKGPRAASRSVLGRLLGIFFRSRWFCLGSRIQPLFPTRRGWVFSVE